jgi:polysaccharide deacetylase 2 family uncharacterized protein YibQ
MKFPNPFKRKGGDDDDEDFDDDESEEEKSSAEETEDGDGDDDEDDEDLEVEGEGGGGFSKILDKPKNRKVFIFGGIGVGVLVIGGVVAMLFLGGDGEDGATAPKGGSKSAVSMDLDAATKGGKKMLTPPKSGREAPLLPQKNGKSGDLPETKHAGSDTKGAALPASGKTKGKAPSGNPARGVAGIQIASVNAASFKKIPEIKSEKPLSAVPDPALVEQASQGQIPKIGKDGRLPLKVYARPFSSSDSRPRIALIVTGLGLSRSATGAAVRRLPGAVTLAFDSYGSNLADWAAAARDAGHETLILLPMETAAFPVRDPGPNAIVSTLEEKENLRRLETVMSRMPGYLGIMNSMGSQFIQDAIRLKPILEAIKARGLMFIDSGQVRKSAAPKVATEIGLPRAISNVIIDRKPSRAYINRQLTRLENIAREQSVSIGIFHPYPVSLQQISAWIKTLDQKKLALGPISSMADVQFVK